MRWETLKVILIGELLRAISPSKVETAVMTEPHQPPNTSTLAICVINDVEPFAPSLNWVFEVSSRVETRRNVMRGHQPGNGKRVGHRLAAHSAAAAVTSATNSWIRA
jgi:hypothetical protein